MYAPTYVFMYVGSMYVWEHRNGEWINNNNNIHKWEKIIQLFKSLFSVVRVRVTTTFFLQVDEILALFQKT
jgi:hypothetical protein